MAWRHIDLCAGTTGFALAALEVWGEDYEPVAFCEINPYCQMLIDKRWPGVPIIHNVHGFNGRVYRKANLVTAGIPCQPFSLATAGKRKGTADDRFLWPSVHRVILESDADWVVLENVTGFDGVALEQVVSDLEASGYEVAPPLEIPACAVGCDHLRPRIWIVGHANRDGESGLPVDGEVAVVPGDHRHTSRMGAPDGVSGRMDRHQLSALGNAVVVPLVVEIFRAIKSVNARVTS